MAKRNPNPTFPDWIKAYGKVRLAGALGLASTASCDAWITGHRKPGLLLAEAIQNLAAKDGVTFTLSYLMGGKK